MKEPYRLLVQTLTKALALGKGLGRRVRRQPDTSVFEEISTGALIGWSACISFSWGYSPIWMAIAALCGLCAGAAIGLLLWTCSAVIPEEKITPPAVSENRADGLKVGRGPPPDP